MSSVSLQMITAFLVQSLILLSVSESVVAENVDNLNKHGDFKSAVMTTIQCHIQLNNGQSFLTCQFPMDIQQAKRNFNVMAVRHGSDVYKLAVACRWQSRFRCTGGSGLVLQNENKTNVTFELPLTESQSMIFSCHLTLENYTSTNCSLPPPSNNSNNLQVAIIIGVLLGGVYIVAAIALIMFLKLKHRKKRKRGKIGADKKTDVGQRQQYDGNVKTGEAVKEEGNNNNERREQDPLLPETKDKPSESTDFQKDPPNQSDRKCFSSSTLDKLVLNESATNKPAAAIETPEDGPNTTLLLQPKESCVGIDEHVTLKQWADKQRHFLQSCQHLTNETGEEEVDQHMKKCRKLTFEIKFKMDLQATLRSGTSLDEYSSESAALGVIFTEAEKTIMFLESLQIALFRKKLTKKLKVGSAGNKTRLEAIDDFIKGAKQLADNIEYEIDGNREDLIEQNFKRLLEVELECDYHKVRMKGSLNSCTSNLRPEYAKRLLDLEGLQDHFVDCRAMAFVRLNDILRCSVLQRMNQKKNSQTEYWQILKKDISAQELETVSFHLKKDKNLDELLPTHEKESIIIPAKHKSHVYAKTKLIGHKKVDILVPKDDQSHCNIKDLDNVHKKIHTAFSQIKDEISPQEMMILMTQTNLDMYNKIVPTIPVDRKGTSSLERIPKTKENHSDIMIVNKQRGVLGGIVQSVHLTDPVTVGKVLTDSAYRLTEAANFIEQWLKTVPKADNVAVRMTLILPNISRKQLDEQLATAVRNVVCLCKEEMDTLEGLKVWWEDCWKVEPEQFAIMDSSLYRNLLKTFAVPAIQVQKYLTKETNSQHENEAVASYNCRNRSSIFSHWSLLSSIEKLVDFDCLDDTQDDVKFLWGPSGTGKTILLQLRALQWASHFGARQIFILQTTEDGTAAACLVEHQLQSEVDVECTFTHLDLSRLWNRKPSQGTTRGSTVVLTEEGKKILSTPMGLQESIHTGTAVHFVADEADGDVVAAVYQLLKAKGAAVVRLWAAGSKEFLNNGILPSSLRHAACHVTEPLVCPKPAKGGEQKSEEGKQKTGRSPSLEILRHTRDIDRHTSSVYPWRCEQCSKDIVDKLKSHSVDAAGGDVQKLSANDVFVMGSELACDKPDDDEFSPAPLIRILQSSGYNVSAMSTSSARDHVMSVIRKTMKPPAVTVTNEKYVWGLERNIIVYCESGPAADMDSKLRAICTTTRILIDIKSE